MSKLDLDDLREQLPEIILEIPGYDPHRDAGDCFFDDDAALAAIGFFQECLQHVKGRWDGDPFVLRRWQIAVIANLFGWLRPDGYRRFRRLLLYLPRRNGKSILAAGIMLYLLYADGEGGPEIYSAAFDKFQATLIWSMASEMVRRQPALNRHSRIYTTYKSIEVPAIGGYYRALSGEYRTKHGLSVHGAVIDELHIQRTDELVDVMEKGTGSRDQPIIVYTTTADCDRPDSICNKIHDEALDVCKGTIQNPAFLPVIYEAEKENTDWQSPETWEKANPNLGISPKLEYIEAECEKAKRSNSDKLNFLRFNLNIITTNFTKWIKEDKWNASAGDVKIENLFNRQCIGAIDLGATSDLTSLVLLFDLEDHYEALFWNWVPEESARRRLDHDRVKYLEWAEQGWIELTPGDEIDYEWIERRIDDIGMSFGIEELAADRLFQGAQLCQGLSRRGFNVVPYGMGYVSMAMPTRELERLINRGELHHGNNPLVTWTAGNVVVRQDPAGNFKPDKEKSKEKIDPIVALLMALGRTLARKADDAPPSQYSNSEMTVG